MQGFEPKHHLALARMRGMQEFEIFLEGLQQHRKWVLEKLVHAEGDAVKAYQERAKVIDDLNKAYKNAPETVEKFDKRA